MRNQVPGFKVDGVAEQDWIENTHKPGMLGKILKRVLKGKMKMGTTKLRNRKKLFER